MLRPTTARLDLRGESLTSRALRGAGSRCRQYRPARWRRISAVRLR
ncbi:hypothetical protein HBB16_18960 [Pseudonocardia sp. MCCB 268]|nr:hypothetical protein [Pseudonocardia cytotoxica]